MSEIEQLRKEVNELRERLARLEAGPPIPSHTHQVPMGYWQPPKHPTWVAQDPKPDHIFC